MVKVIRLRHKVWAHQQRYRGSEKIGVTCVLQRIKRESYVCEKSIFGRVVLWKSVLDFAGIRFGRKERTDKFDQLQQVQIKFVTSSTRIPPKLQIFGTLAIDIGLLELLIFIRKQHFNATLIYCSSTYRPFRSPHRVNYRSLQCHPLCVDDLCIRYGVFICSLRGWGRVFVASSLLCCMPCRKVLTGWLIYTYMGLELFVRASLSSCWLGFGFVGV